MNIKIRYTSRNMLNQFRKIVVVNVKKNKKKK